MPSKEVADRLKDAELLTRATESHAEIVGDKLTDMLQRYTRRGDPVPDLGTAMALLGRRLKALGEAMRAADRANEIAITDEAAAAALAKKEAAVAEYDAAFGDTATLVSVLLRTVGEDAMAMRVRPSTTRPGRVADSRGVG